MSNEQKPNTKDHKLFDLLAEDICSNPRDYYEAGGWLDDHCSEKAYWIRQEAELESLKKDAVRVLSLLPRVQSLQQEIQERRTPSLTVRFQGARNYLLDKNETQTLISLENAKRILIVTWLLTDPDAENASVELTDVQKWLWQPTDDITSMSRGTKSALWAASGAGYERWVALAHKAWSRVRRMRVDRTVPAAKTGGETQHTGSDVFIVHGHDDSTKNEVARFVEKLGLRAIILHEQANRGRTIIEKFEDHANVGFAVVVMTPDDVGASKGQEANLKPRARQNVILELGFFLGKLGRERVCPLHKGGLEMPSDYQGVLFVPLDDNGAWKTSLAKEIEATGIKVDRSQGLS